MLSRGGSDVSTSSMPFSCATAQIMESQNASRCFSTPRSALASVRAPGRSTPNTSSIPDSASRSRDGSTGGSDRFRRTAANSSRFCRTTNPSPRFARFSTASLAFAVRGSCMSVWYARIRTFVSIRTPLIQLLPRPGIHLPRQPRPHRTEEILQPAIPFAPLSRASGSRQFHSDIGFARWTRFLPNVVQHPLRFFMAEEDVVLAPHRLQKRVLGQSSRQDSSPHKTRSRVSEVFHQKGWSAACARLATYLPPRLFTQSPANPHPYARRPPQESIDFIFVEPQRTSGPLGFQLPLPDPQVEGRATDSKLILSFFAPNELHITLFNV